MERRDFPDPYGGDDAGNGTFQTRWVSAGRFPWEMDITSPFGFWSTMATPVGDTKKFGDRALWRGFITYFKGNDDPKLIDLALEYRHETARAYLVFDGDKEVWVPKSMVEYDVRDKVFTMPEWLAQREGLI